MKSTELMLGDWVNVAEFGIIDQIMTFTPDTAITGHGDTCGEYEYERLEPIPLTADILTKNGIAERTENTTFRDNTRYYQLGDGDLCLEHWVSRNEWSLIVLYEGYTGAIESYMLRALKYVHELQHILRACGINKDIEL